MLPDDSGAEPVLVRPEEIPEELPALPVSDAVIFPHMLVPLLRDAPRLRRPLPFPAPPRRAPGDLPVDEHPRHAEDQRGGQGEGELEDGFGVNAS